MEIVVPSIISHWFPSQNAMLIWAHSKWAVFWENRLKEYISEMVASGETERLLTCGVWFVISPAQLGGWMCREWEILSHASLFFSFLIPFSLSSPTKIYDWGKDKEKQMQTLSQESLLDYISALLTNCLIKFTWLGRQIRGEILTPCLPVSHWG